MLTALMILILNINRKRRGGATGVGDMAAFAVNVVFLVEVYVFSYEALHDIT